MNPIDTMKQELRALKTRSRTESGRTHKRTNYEMAELQGKIRQAQNIEWICICGKPIPEGKLYCSDRCDYIAEKMDSPLGRQMTDGMAVRFFGKQWDRNHE